MINTNAIFDAICWSTANALDDGYNIKMILWWLLRGE